MADSTSLSILRQTPLSSEIATKEWTTENFLSISSDIEAGVSAIVMNDITKYAENNVINLGTVLTAHQSLSDLYLLSSETVNGISNVITPKLSDVADLIEEEAAKLDELSGKLSSYSLTGHTHTSSDITNFPPIPTVNNGSLTIQKNGTAITSFTANQSSNVTANIEVPLSVSQLTNDSGYLTSSDLDLAKVMEYQGTVTTYADLPVNAKKGDVYDVISAYNDNPPGTNYAWNGTTWDPLGGSIDVSKFATKSQLENYLPLSGGTVEALTAGGIELDSESTNITADSITVSFLTAGGIEASNESTSIIANSLTASTLTAGGIEVSESTNITADYLQTSTLSTYGIEAAEYGTSITATYLKAPGMIASVSGKEGLSVTGIEFGDGTYLSTASGIENAETKINELSGKLSSYAEKDQLSGVVHLSGEETLSGYLYYYKQYKTTDIVFSDLCLVFSANPLSTLYASPSQELTAYDAYSGQNVSIWGQIEEYSTDYWYDSFYLTTGYSASSFDLRFYKAGSESDRYEWTDSDWILHADDVELRIDGTIQANGWDSVNSFIEQYRENKEVNDRFALTSEIADVSSDVQELSTKVNVLEGEPKFTAWKTNYGEVSAYSGNVLIGSKNVLPSNTTSSLIIGDNNSLLDVSYGNALIYAHRLSVGIADNSYGGANTIINHSGGAQGQPHKVYGNRNIFISPTISSNTNSISCRSCIILGDGARSNGMILPTNIRNTTDRVIALGTAPIPNETLWYSYNYPGADPVENGGFYVHNLKLLGIDGNIPYSRLSSALTNIKQFDLSGSNTIDEANFSIQASDGSDILNFGKEFGDSIALGYGVYCDATRTTYENIVIGKEARIYQSERTGSVKRSVAIGKEATVEAGCQDSIAIGTSAVVSAAFKAIQLGIGTNTLSGTTQIRDWQLLDANGNIPEDRVSAIGYAKAVDVPLSTSQLINDSNFLTAHQSLSDIYVLSGELVEGLSNVVIPKLDTISGLVEEEVDKLDEISVKLDDYSPIGHTHVVSDITDFPTPPTVGKLNTTLTASQTPVAAESLSGTVSLHKISKTGNYYDLLNKPTYYVDISSDQEISGAKTFCNNVEIYAEDKDQWSTLGFGEITLNDGRFAAAHVSANADHGLLLDNDNYNKFALPDDNGVDGVRKLAAVDQLPTVNNGTLTIQKNGSTITSFTANQSNSVTANITVPLSTSQLTNDSGYLTTADINLSGSNVINPVAFSLQNSTGQNYLNFGTNYNRNGSSVVLGQNSFEATNRFTVENVVIGYGANVNGINSAKSAFDNIAIGNVASISGASNAIAIGPSAVISSVDGAIQIGTGTNDLSGTTNIKEWQLLDAKGNIPYARISSNVNLSAIEEVYTIELTEDQKTALVTESGMPAEAWGDFAITINTSTGFGYIGNLDCFSVVQNANGDWVFVGGMSSLNVLGWITNSTVIQGSTTHTVLSVGTTSADLALRSDIEGMLPLAGGGQISGGFGVVDIDGYNLFAINNYGGVAIGYDSKWENQSGIAIGQTTSADGMGVAIGYDAKATANAVQLGTGSNLSVSTLQFRNYPLVDANGNIPEARLSSVGYIKKSDADALYVSKQERTLLPILSSNALTVELSSDIEVYRITDTAGSGTFPTLYVSTAMSNLQNCYYAFEIEWKTNSSAAQFPQTFDWINYPEMQTDGQQHTYYIAGRYDTTNSEYTLNCWRAK